MIHDDGNFSTSRIAAPYYNRFTVKILILENYIETHDR
jgi:hypothetical protein